MTKTALAFFLSALLPLLSMAQVSTECAGSIPPTLTAVTDTIVCMGTINVSLTTSSNLPTTEYVVTHKGMLADDGLGDDILGTSVTNTIDPVTEGVTTGMTFEVTAVSYNLTQIQDLIDDLYNNTFIGIACCTWANAGQPGVCDSLMNAGVNSGADIQNLEDGINVFNTLSGTMGTSSIAGLIGQIDQFNTDAAVLPASCGGSLLPLCYAVDQGETNTFYYQPVPSIDMITDGCPGSPSTITVMASVSAGILEYSTDGTNYQSSNVLTAATDPVMIFVQETTCDQVSSQSYNLGCALPVTLIAFSGRETSRGHELEWRTSFAENFDYFSVEHSSNGITFSHLVDIEALQPSGINNYQYTSKAITSTENYYRLKMVDRDGTFTFSKVVSITSSAHNQISLFPNPVSDQLFTTVTSSKIHRATIFDSSGKLVSVIDWSDEDGKFSTAISTVGWNPGLYFMQLELEGEVVVKKFVVK